MSVSFFSHLPFSRCDAGSREVPQYLFQLSAFGQEQWVRSRIFSLEAASALVPPSLWPRAKKTMQNDSVCDQCSAKLRNFCAGGTMYHKVHRVPWDGATVNGRGMLN